MNEPLLSLQGICFSYGRGRQVLDGLTLELMPGERLALMGSNGSGKTTLLRIIVGLLRPSAGTLRAFGRVRRREEDFREVRRRAGLLFQDPEDQLFCPTVAEDVAFGPLNLGMSRDDAMSTVSETLAELGLAGYEDRITYRLSGGEKRLVSLAAVLAMRPEVLLLDEPANELDEAHTRQFLDILARLPQAVVIVSHNRGLLRSVATRGVLLNAGAAAPCEI